MQFVVFIVTRQSYRDSGVEHGLGRVAVGERITVARGMEVVQAVRGMRKH